MLQSIDRLSRRQKQAVLLVVDMGLFAFSLWAAFAIRFEDLTPDFRGKYLWIFGAILLARVPIFIRMGLYRAVLRQAGPELTRICLRGTAWSLFALGAFLWLYSPAGVPRSVVLIEAAISALLTLGLREFVSSWLQRRTAKAAGSEPVLIYGAGVAGSQLAQALRLGSKFRPVAFVDDEPSKWGLRVAGLPVHPPATIQDIVTRRKITRALLAAPSLPAAQRATMVRRLEDVGLRVQQVPGMLDLLRGDTSLAELRDVQSADLLRRGTVLPDSQLFRQVVPGRSVLVTGAGGSIGAEVCRQVAALRPKRLVLFERSEYALYQIEMELGERFPELEVAAVLGSVLDRDRLEAAYRRFEVDSVYHAAAYKHVPLVEQNPVEGIQNNVFGTLTAAEAARDCGVQTFVLISTDKAVRPSNVMGASKRVAELACLALADKDAEGKPSKTRYAMVRFGNVLDSAGSVVPLFRKQIAMGGPVTVTDPEVTRYFMTIPEAAQLVVQASALGAGGEVFLLDMGEPVKIRDLAERMIELATVGTGREIKIEYTGLRPGEKLVEELLVESKNSQPTGHPKIFKAVESGPPTVEVVASLVRLRKAIERNDLASVYMLLEELVESYSAPTEVNDVLKRSGVSFSFGQPQPDEGGDQRKGPRPLAG
ncbi:MAG: polysaccharide biosynthesis protein [Planctomycetes bacterium]|nr:polysaccharide biosynthesis protein [Planctomycetota bacterium]